MQRRISGQNSHSRNNRQKPVGKTGGRAGSRSSFGKSSGRSGAGKSTGRSGFGKSAGHSRFGKTAGRSSFGRSSHSEFESSDDNRSESPRSERRSFGKPFAKKLGSGRPGSGRPSSRPSGGKFGRSSDRSERRSSGRSFDSAEKRAERSRGPREPQFESEEARQRWLKDRENYEFFHNVKKPKPFDPANPSGFDDDDDDIRRPERLPEPDVYESVKSNEEPRGKRLITGFSANDDKVKRTRKPLKRVLTDKTAEGRKAHKEKLESEGGLKRLSDRPLPEMKHRAKAEPRTRKTVKARKAEASQSDDVSGIRLQKLLAAAGLGSRRACEDLITSGRVDIDGKTVSELGVCVMPGQKVRVDGETINQGKRHYFMLNKPEKFICTNADPSGRWRAIDLIHERIPGLYPVGRLDMSSTGLLLITNDGELANRLTHPSYEVQKIYRVHVSGTPSREVIKKMCDGIYIAEGKVHADSAKVKQTYKNGTSIIEMVLSEGKNREIRRILARLGHNVLDLTRIAIGPVKLGNMPKGAYRRLTTAEVRQLKEMVGMR